MSALGASWRLARREVIRHRWRSVLVLALVGLPVMISVTLSTLAASQFVPASDRLAAELGNAEASVTWVGGRVEQSQGGYSVDESPDDPAKALTLAQAQRKATALADGPVVPHLRSATSLIFGGRAWRVDTLATDFTSPLTASALNLTDGRYPETRAEFVGSVRTTRGMHLGQSVLVGGARMKLVGVSDPDGLSFSGDLVAFLPDASVQTELSRGMPPLPGEPPSESISNWSFLVGGKPIGQTEATAWNDAGFTVTSRHLDELGPIDYLGGDTWSQLVAIIVVALVIEVVLLAGPAFAVGARRQRHELALLAVAGGSPRDLRRVVLLQAALLGLTAALAGAALGVLTGWVIVKATMPFGPAYPFGPFDVSWAAVVAAVALAVLAATAAAYLPARQAAHADVVAVLAGRQPEPRARRGWPIIGGLVLLIGTAGSIAAPRNDSGDFANAWWAIVSVVGAILMTPWLISRVARVARLLPLPARLAVRDADRHRSRTAPAVAAIMASVSAVTALGIASSSDAAQGAHLDVPLHPVGTVTVTSGQMDSLVRVAKRELGITLTPLTIVDEVNWADATYLGYENNQTAVADAKTLAAWGLRLTASQRRGLERGAVLVGPQVGAKNGAIVVHTQFGPIKSRTVHLPAIPTNLSDQRVATKHPRPIVGAAMSAATARSLRIEPQTQQAIAARPLSKAEIRRLELAAATVDPVNWHVEVQGPPANRYFWVYIVLAVAGTLAVLIGTFSATGLALADARPDMATLGAVGASPSTRRLVGGAHALFLALLGAALGVVVGLTPGLVAADLLTGGSAMGPPYGPYVTDVDQPAGVLDIPWLLFALLLIGLPLLAGVITAALSRGPSPKPVRETV